MFAFRGGVIATGLDHECQTYHCMGRCFPLTVVNGDIVDALLAYGACLKRHRGVRLIPAEQLVNE